MFGKNKERDEEHSDVENQDLNDQEVTNAEELNTDNASAETDELELERQKSAELHDKYLRLYSEFENFRRRTNKEKAEIIQYSNKDMLLNILPVFDDLERANELAAKAEDKASIIEGFEHIYKKFKLLLERSGLTEIGARGDVFDSELHDAITTIPAPSADMKGKVVDAIQKGYKLNDKVIRHAKVVVGE